MELLESLKNKKALIVDDEELIREIIARELEDLEVSVDEAENGTVAFDKIQKDNYDFIISDVRMPGGSGRDLLQNIHKANKNVFIVMVTGFSDLTEEEARSLGAKAVFEKPFNIENIFNFIASNLPS